METPKLSTPFFLILGLTPPNRETEKPQIGLRNGIVLRIRLLKSQFVLRLFGYFFVMIIQKYLSASKPNLPKFGHRASEQTDLYLANSTSEIPLPFGLCSLQKLSFRNLLKAELLRFLPFSTDFSQTFSYFL